MVWAFFYTVVVSVGKGDYFLSICLTGWNLRQPIAHVCVCSAAGQGGSLGIVRGGRTMLVS